jgi:hypothetical protein
MTKNIYIFSPFAGIWPHSYAEVQIVKQLIEGGLRPILIQCNSILDNFCTVMESFKLDQKATIKLKKDTCKKCKLNAQVVKEELSVPTFNLDDFLTRSDLNEVNQLSKLVTPENYLDFKYLGINVGKNAAYETILKFKKISSTLKPHEFDYYKKHLTNYLITVKSANNFLQRDSSPMAIAYSPQYSATNAFLEMIAKMNGIGYFIEGSANLNERYSHIRIWNWSKYKLLDPAKNAWYACSSHLMPTNSDQKRITNHFELISKGKSHSTYSDIGRKMSIRQHFNIPKDNRVILCLLSSSDESFSAFLSGFFPKQKVRSRVFDNQFDWVSFTMNWAEKHKHITLVVRTHPRDLPNKRNSNFAEHVEIWDNLLKTKAENIIFDRGLDKIPLEDYWKEINLIITGWSSTALEALWNGVPALTYDENLPSYPKDIHVTGKTIKDYSDNLNRFLESNFVVDRRKLLKWLHFNFNLGTVSHGDTLAAVTNSRPTLFRALNFVLGIVFPKFTLKFDLFRNQKFAADPKLLRIIKERRDSLYDLS